MNYVTNSETIPIRRRRHRHSSTNRHRPSHNRKRQAQHRHLAAIRAGKNRRLSAENCGPESEQFRATAVTRPNGKHCEKYVKFYTRRIIENAIANNENLSSFALIQFVGLRNLGNTCFMNSVLQSLSNIREFSCYFSALPSLESKQQQQKRVYHSRSLKENVNDANVVEELRKILTNLSQGGDGTKAISPECLFLVIWKVVPQFRGHRQHDAHEFLRYMLDRLHTELQHLSVPIEHLTSKTNKLNYSGSSSIETGSIMFKGRSSIVTNVFGGTLQSEVVLYSMFLIRSHRDSNLICFCFLYFPHPVSHTRRRFTHSNSIG